YFGNIHVWDRETGKLARQIAVAPKSWCRSLTFSGDGRLLAAHVVRQHLTVWNLADGQERCRMPFKASECGLALSPDGRRLACADMQGTIRLWETETGVSVFELRGLGPAFSTMNIRAQVAF